MLSTTTVEKMTIEIHKLYRKLNEDLFNNELPNCAIVIESKGNRKAYGWCTVGEVWQSEKEGLYEIGLASEHINRPFLETATTLLHEMIHLHNGVKGIKDTSRGYTYHNTNFKKQCIEHGMAYDVQTASDPKNGWNKPNLTDLTIKKIQAYGIDEEVFTIGRIDFSNLPSKKKQTSWKWTCPCGTSVRSSKPVINIACLDCGGKFEVQE